MALKWCRTDLDGEREPLADLLADQEESL